MDVPTSLLLLSRFGNTGRYSTSLGSILIFLMAKFLRIIGLILIVGAAGRWAYDCSRYGETVFYTKTSKITVTTTVDPLFGTAVSSTTSEPGYWLGLLDSTFPFGAIPICGIGTIFFIGGSIAIRRQRKSAMRDV